MIEFREPNTEESINIAKQLYVKPLRPDDEYWTKRYEKQEKHKKDMLHESFKRKVEAKKRKKRNKLRRINK